MLCSFSFLSSFLLSFSLSLSIALCIFCVPYICEVYIFIYLFIYFLLHWVFVAVCGLSLAAASGGYSWLCCGARASHCGGFFLLHSRGFRHVGFSSCGLQASVVVLMGSRAQAQ